MENFEVPLQPMAIQLTEKAAEMVKESMEVEGYEGYGLRVGVKGGGCSGLQYSLDFSKESSDLDFVENQYGIKVFIDPFSAAHLMNTTIDYADSLYGSGFKFNNANAVRSCGCGQSFR